MIEADRFGGHALVVSSHVQHKEETTMPGLDWSQLSGGSTPPELPAQAPNPHAVVTATNGDEQAGRTQPSPLSERAVMDAAGGATRAASQPLTASSLHPALRLIIADNLRGDAVDASNLCTIVGTITRERWPDRSRRNERNGNQRAQEQQRTQGEERTFQTDLGINQALFRMEVQEVVGDAAGAAFEPYSMQLTVSNRLLNSGLFIDGQRLAVSGPLRVERTYDRRFARNDLDPGLPDWETRLDVITVQAVSDDTPDGSWVQLEGELDGDPIVRSRPIGERAFAPFATVRLRNRQPLRGAFARSKAVYHASVIVPLEVSLDGAVEHAGALLKKGNLVRIEGRLAPYVYQRRPSPRMPQIEQALASLEERLRAEGGGNLERRLRNAKQRLLRATGMAVEVGYIELKHGTALTEEEVTDLIARRPRAVQMPYASGSPTAPAAKATTITSALDVATSALQEQDPADDEPLGDDAATLPRLRPRKRTRDQEAAGVTDTDAA
jgi:single-stranded DNA-binding protein